VQDGVQSHPPTGREKRREAEIRLLGRGPSDHGSTVNRLEQLELARYGKSSILRIGATGASFFTLSKRKGLPHLFRLKTARLTISR
jgi:hypothetical protein